MREPKETDPDFRLSYIAALRMTSLEVVFEVEAGFGEVVPGFDVGHDGHVGACEIVLCLQAS